MKKLKTALSRIVYCFLCLLLIGNMASAAFAAPGNFQFQTDGELSQKVFLERYELTDERIVPGSQFTLKLSLKNIGTVNAENVIVDVVYPIGVMPIYGTVSQAIVDVPAEGTAEVEIAYNALDKIVIPALDFQIVLRENGLENTTILRIPVGLQSPFDVIATFVPAKAVVGESVNCSMTFKYRGAETADKIQARMNVNGDPVRTVEIGSLPKETTKTQSLFEQFDDAGQYVVEMYLDYQDESGREKSVQVGTSLLEIEEKHEMPAKPDSAGQKLQPEDTAQTGRQSADIRVLAACGILIAAICVLIVFLIRKKK